MKKISLRNISHIIISKLQFLRAHARLATERSWRLSSSIHTNLEVKIVIRDTTHVHTTPRSGRKLSISLTR